MTAAQFLVAHKFFSFAPNLILSNHMDTSLLDLGISPEEDRNDIWFDHALKGLFGLRYVLLLVLSALSPVHWRRESREEGDLEALRALDQEVSANNVNSTVSSSPTYGTYGTFKDMFSSPKTDTTAPVSGMMSSSEEEILKKLETEKAERASAFNNFWSKIKNILPFVYPKNDRWLQFMVLLTFILIALGRVVNKMVPFLTGDVVRQMERREFNIKTILIYVMFRYLQGGSGLISAAETWAWIPIEQYSNSSLTIRFFEHLHNLSLQFHLNRKTGELLRILDRGTSSIVSLLNTVVFQLIPVVADVIIAVVTFGTEWSWKYGLIVGTSVVLYLVVTILVTEWRTRFRRAMISFDNDASAKAVDSLLNFETVKYYSAENFEVTRYREAINRYMIADYKSRITFQMLNVIQSFVITIGMLAGCLLVAYEISIGERDPAE